MSDNRITIGDNEDEALQRIFESAQDLQRRVYRSGRRGFLVRHAISELRHSVNGIAQEIAVLEQIADGTG
jgi:hypothetical protein